MLMASADGSFGFAQDDGTGGLGNQMACFGLVLVMRLRRIPSRPIGRPLLQGATHVRIETTPLLPLSMPADDSRAPSSKLIAHSYEEAGARVVG